MIAFVDEPDVRRAANQGGAFSRLVARSPPTPAYLPSALGETRLA
jgi:hypothetical protein